MDEVTNPYMPGAGMRPVALLGRDAQQDQWTTQLARAEHGRPGRSSVLYGLRGVGKTVLLGKLHEEAEQREWVAGFIEAGTGKGLRELVSEAFQLPLLNLARPSASEKIKAALKTFVSFKASVDSTGTWTFGLDLDGADGGGADSGALEMDLLRLILDLTTATREDGKGVALLIDEAQDLTNAEMATLCSLVHIANQRSLPFVVALAGLPSLPAALAEAKSYTERLFQFSHIQHLPDHDARAVLTEPARLESVEWESDAVTLAVEVSRGYPYFLQEFGSKTWSVAPGPGITQRDAELGCAEGLRELDNGFFRARWDRATPQERDYLKAMAVDGDAGSNSRAVADRLGKSMSQISVARSNLIAKGLIYAPEHGRVAFTVPQMADFISRQHA